MHFIVLANVFSFPSKTTWKNKIRPMPETNRFWLFIWDHDQLLNFQNTSQYDQYGKAYKKQLLLGVYCAEAQQPRLQYFIIFLIYISSIYSPRLPPLECVQNFTTLWAKASSLNLSQNPPFLINYFPKK